MQRDTIRRTGLAALAFVCATGAVGCQGHRIEASTRATYHYAADRVYAPELFGNGPTLVAGDNLAMTMLVAGAYDIAPDPGSRFADAPATTE